MRAVSGTRNPIGSFPSWCGIWTGFKPTKLVAPEGSQGTWCYAFGKIGSENHLMQFIREAKTDSGRRIKCKWFSAGMGVAAAFEYKRVSRNEIWIEAYKGPVDITLSASADGCKIFGESAKAMIDSIQDVVGVSDTDEILVGIDQNRSKFVLPFPLASFNTSTRESNLFGCIFQYILAWEGYMSFSRFRSTMEIVPQVAHVYDAGMPTKLQGQLPDYYDYIIEN